MFNAGGVSGVKGVVVWLGDDGENWWECELAWVELFAGIGKEEDELARIFDGSLSLSLLLILSTNIAAEFYK